MFYSLIWIFLWKSTEVRRWTSVSQQCNWWSPGAGKITFKNRIWDRKFQSHCFKEENTLSHLNNHSALIYHLDYPRMRKLRPIWVSDRFEVWLCLLICPAPHMNILRSVWVQLTSSAHAHFTKMFLNTNNACVPLSIRKIMIALLKIYLDCFDCQKNTRNPTHTCFENSFRPEIKKFLLTWKFQVDLKTETDLRNRNDFQVDLSFILPVSCEHSKGFDRKPKWVSNRSETQTGLSLLMWG